MTAVTVTSLEGTVVWNNPVPGLGGGAEGPEWDGKNLILLVTGQGGLFPPIPEVRCGPSPRLRPRSSRCTTVCWKPFNQAVRRSWSIRIVGAEAHHHGGRASHPQVGHDGKLLGSQRWPNQRRQSGAESSSIATSMAIQEVAGLRRRYSSPYEVMPHGHRMVASGPCFSQRPGRYAEHRRAQPS